MVPQVVAEGADLPLLPLEALVVAFPEGGQLVRLLQPLVVFQYQYGVQQGQGGEEDKGEHRYPQIHNQAVEKSVAVDIIRLEKGQQHHRQQRAEGHGGQEQHQPPKPGGELGRALWQVFPRRQVQQGPDGEADEFIAVVIQVVQIEAGHNGAIIGIQHGVDGHDEAEKDDRQRQPPGPVPLGGQQEHGEKEQQDEQQIGVPQPNHHVGDAAQKQDQRDSPAPPGLHRQKGGHDPKEEEAAGKHRDQPEPVLKAVQQVFRQADQKR